MSIWPSWPHLRLVSATCYLSLSGAIDDSFPFAPTTTEHAVQPAAYFHQYHYNHQQLPRTSNQTQWTKQKSCWRCRASSSRTADSSSRGVASVCTPTPLHGQY